MRRENKSTEIRTESEWQEWRTDYVTKYTVHAPFANTNGGADESFEVKYEKSAKMVYERYMALITEYNGYDTDHCTRNDYLPWWRHICSFEDYKKSFSKVILANMQ